MASKKFYGCTTARNSNKLICSIHNAVYDPTDKKSYSECDPSTVSNPDKISDFYPPVCSVSCGGGKLIKSRYCLYPPCNTDKVNMVEDVLSFDKSLVICNTNPCQIDNFKPNLSNDPTNRMCQFPYLKDNILHETCFYDATDNFFKCSTTFNYDNDNYYGICPIHVHNKWSSWKIETGCSQNCGGGFIYETRRCYVPPCPSQIEDVFYEKINFHKIQFVISGQEFPDNEAAKQACFSNIDCAGYFYESKSQKYLLASGEDLVLDQFSTAYFSGNKNLQKRPIESCNTQKCKNCILGSGEGYEGRASKTFTGKICLNWKQVDSKLYFANSDKLISNYCRNILGSKSLPWCYINEEKDWEYCSLKNCEFESDDILMVGLKGVSKKCQFPFNYGEGNEHENSELTSKLEFKTCIIHETISEYPICKNSQKELGIGWG